MRQIQFIGVSPEDLKNEIIVEIISQLKEIKSKITPPKNEEYLTRKEVAKILNVSLVTLNDWDKKGIIQPYRIGNLVRYKKTEIEGSLKLLKR